MESITKQIAVNKNDLFAITASLSSDIIIALNTKFEILDFNPSAEHFYGWKAKQVIGKNYLKLSNKSDFLTPIDELYLNHSSYLEVNCDLKNSKSIICTVNWKVVPVYAEEQLDSILLVGKPDGIKKNNIAHYLNNIIEMSPGSIYWKDLNGRYIGCNEFMVKTAGLNSIDDIIGKTDFDLWPSNAKKIIENDKYVVESESTVILEEEVCIADGTRLYFTGVKQPLRDEDGNIIGVIGNSLDITRLKHTEQELKEAKEKAEAANKLKSAFIRDMEHDIRTPFTGIYSLARSLFEGETDPRKKELLGYVSSSAKELLDYCNAILDFSRIEAGTLPVMHKKFNLHELLRSIIVMEKPAAKASGLELLFHMTSDVPKVVTGDAYRIQRILVNLISNAIKFTKVGYVKLIVEVTETKRRKAIISFLVEDTGIGIPTQQQDIIFERFTRISPANKGLYKGNGLGLRAVRQFMEELEGEIDVKSEPNKGTIFVCSIPLQIALTQELPDFDALRQSKSGTSPASLKAV